MRILWLAAALVLAAAPIADPALAQPTHDRRVEAAAATRAAERLGAIRGAISHDASVSEHIRSAGERAAPENLPAPQAPARSALPPMVMHGAPATAQAAAA